MLHKAVGQDAQAFACAADDELVIQAQVCKAVMLHTDEACDCVKNDEFSKLSSYDFVMLKDMGGLLLISELYDEKNDQWAYYVVNATDSGISSEMSVTLTFNDYENVQMVQSMNTFNAGLKEHTITFELGSGRAAIVMPY